MAMSKFGILIAFAAIVSVDAEINRDASYVKLAFHNSSSTGSDGPWWFLHQAVDSPNQFIEVRPGIVRSTLVIADDACDLPAVCPRSEPTLWEPSAAYNATNGTSHESAKLEAASWDPWVSQLLNLSGKGRYTANRMTLRALSDSLTMDGTPIFVSDGFQSTFPGGASYTLDTGFMSLNGGPSNISWQQNSDGQAESRYNTIASAFYDGYIPSLSYGLHIGSVSPKLIGNFILGGYDSSRVILPPIISENSSFELIGIALNVSSGGHAWLDTQTPVVDGLMAGHDSLQVYANPAVSHMHLPSTICNAIAKYLPVTYHPEFNLYLWDTSSEAYNQIVTSPHYMQFVFRNGNDTSESAINVPFALLNLTLSWPLVSEPQQYFPCSPWDRSDIPPHLGAAFLQAAFLGANWETNTTFLAQAPGPSGKSPQRVLTILHNTTSIDPALNAPSWEYSWEHAWTPLPMPNQSGLSTGAKAGIGVGVAVGALAIIAAVVFVVIHRRRKRRAQSDADEAALDQSNTPVDPIDSNMLPDSGNDNLVQPDQPTKAEDDTQQLPAEWDMAEMGSGTQFVELGDKTVHEKSGIAIQELPGDSPDNSPGDAPAYSPDDAPEYSPEDPISRALAEKSEIEDHR